jgi:hypothetical protein
MIDAGVAEKWRELSTIIARTEFRTIRLAYQLPASSTFLSEQTSHQQSASSTFLSEQISNSYQPPAQRLFMWSSLKIRTRCKCLQYHTSNLRFCLVCQIITVHLSN